MLFSRLKKELMKPARPARRRSYARTIELQDLEPRLFLSVNSLVADDGAAKQEETPADVGVESTSIDSVQLDASIETSVTDESAASGYGGGPVAMATDPYFTSAEMSYDEFGYHVSGNVAWDDNPFFLSGMQINIYDPANNNALAGHAYTDFNGDFVMGNVGVSSVKIELLHPFTGSVVDTEYLSY